MAKATVMVSWDDIPHITNAQKKAMLASIPPWQRDSRSRGTPQLGAGAIYQIVESEIVVPGFAIPKHWTRSFGMDVGWNKTAVVWLAEDRDTSTAYVYDEYYRGQAEPSVHAAAIKNRGAWIPGAIDPAARGRSQIDGGKLFDMYSDLGLDIEKAINAREAGIYAVWERLSQGRLKFFNSCTNVMSEYRLYRRDEKGQVVKTYDHALDALRYCVMSGLDRGKTEPAGPGGVPWFNYVPPSVWAG